MSGFGGSLEKLKSSIDVAVTSFGEALAPTISKVAEKIQGLVDWFNSLDDSQKQTIAKIAVAVAAIGPVLVAVGKLSTGIGAVIKLVALIAPMMAPVIAAIAPALPIIAAIAAAIALVVLAIKNWDAITKFFSDVWAKFTGAIADFTESMKQAIVDKRLFWHSRGSKQHVAL